MSRVVALPPGAEFPRELVTGLITERGICPASEEGLMALFPEKKI